MEARYSIQQDEDDEAQSTPTPSSSQHVFTPPRWLFAVLLLSTFSLAIALIVVATKSPSRNASADMASPSLSEQLLLRMDNASVLTNPGFIRLGLSSLQARQDWVLPLDWGGSDPDAWTADTLFARAASAELNRVWALPDVVDAIIAAPTSLQDSLYHPYGDGQSNARMSFGSSWMVRSPPLVATLIKFGHSGMACYFRFAAALLGSQQQVQVRAPRLNRSFMLNAQRVPGSNDLLAVMDKVDDGLGWAVLGHTQLVFVRPFPDFDDWFPVFFRQPVQSSAAMIADISPAASRSFPDAKPVLDSEGIKASAAQQGVTPFQALMSHSFARPRWNTAVRLIARVLPATHRHRFFLTLFCTRHTRHIHTHTTYTNTCIQPYQPDPVHGTYGENGPVTAVGQGWTWVALPSSAGSGGDAPFKVLYTCFQQRQPGKEAAHGVVSGGGWHRIGDPAETIFNSLESAPLVVGTGFQNAAKAFSQEAPGALAYGLADVVTVRWLAPGEALVTRRPDFHWFFFQSSSNVCTEEWVHPCVPAGDQPLFQC